MREDYTEEDVEYYFNYSGILAERGSYDTLEDLIKCELHDLGRQALACAFCRHNLSCSMYVYVNRSLLACGQMPTSQLEHLNALWAFAADLHLASGHLLLLYAASASTEASPEMLLVKSAFMRTLCRLVCTNLL